MIVRNSACDYSSGGRDPSHVAQTLVASQEGQRLGLSSLRSDSSMSSLHNLQQLLVPRLVAATDLQAALTRQPRHSATKSGLPPHT